MTIVGDAYIEIKPETRQFEQQLQRETSGHVSHVAANLAKVFAGAFVLKGAFTTLNGFVDAARESNKVAAQTAAALKSTGGAAKVTADQVSELATAISNKTGIDDEAIQSAENLLLTFTNVRNEVGKGNDIFNQATAVLADMGVALGTDTSGAAIQLGKALNDPIAGITALTRVGVTFTDQQKEQIKTLTESGHVVDAQKIILAELNKEFGGSAAASATSADKLKVALGNIQESIGNLLIPPIDAAAERLAVALPKAIDTGTKAFDTLRNGIHGFREAFAGEGTTSDGFVGGMERFGVALKIVSDEVSTRTGVAVDRLRSGFTDLRDIVEKNIDALTVFAGAAAGAGAALLGIQVAGALPGLATLGGALVNIAKGIAAVGTAAVAAVGGGMALLIAAVAAIAIGAYLAYRRFAAFRDIVDNIGRAIRTGFLVAIQKVRDLLEKLAPVATQVGETLRRGLGSALTAAASGTAAAFDAISTAATAVDQALRSVFGPLAQWFKDNVASTFGAGADFIVALFGRIYDVASALATVIRTVLGPVLGILEAEFRILAAAVGNAAQLMVELFGVGIQQLTGVIRGFLEFAGPAWSLLWAGIQGVVTVVASVIQNTVELFLGVIRGLFQTFTGLLTGDWSKVWEGIRTIVTSVFGNAVDIIRTYIETIVGFLRDLPGRIVELVKGIGNAFQEIGKAILEGILGGLRAAGGFAVDFAKAIANALIDLINTQVIKRINDALEITIDPKGPGPKIHLDPPDIPGIPRIPAATGFLGTVTRPTSFLTGEGGRPEDVLVAPHSQGGIAAFVERLTWSFTSIIDRIQRHVSQILDRTFVSVNAKVQRQLDIRLRDNGFGSVARAVDTGFAATGRVGHITTADMFTPEQIAAMQQKARDTGLLPSGARLHLSGRDQARINEGIRSATQEAADQSHALLLQQMAKAIIGALTDHGTLGMERQPLIGQVVIPNDEPRSQIRQLQNMLKEAAHLGEFGPAWGT